jgi:phenylalanyl-tRNA synthetase alpha chain
MMAVEDAILGTLETSPSLSSLELCRDLHTRFPDEIENHQQLHRVLLSLETANLIALEKQERKGVELSDEGQLYAKEGSPEYKYAQIAAESPGLPVKELSALVGERLASLYTRPIPSENVQQIANAAFGRARQLSLITIDSGAVTAGDLTKDPTRDQLNQFAADPDSVPAKDAADLRKRSLIVPVTIKWFTITKGASWVPQKAQVRPRVVELTEDLVKSGQWQGVEFSPLNFDALGAPAMGGHEHPLLKVRYEFRQIFLAMGFEEMDTYRWVESSFWNFDSLFQGQQHPCRDVHDTFFLSEPEKAKPIADAEYFARVRDVHESGGFGSIGLRYKFDNDFAMTNILRTHTTACSSRYLKMLADEFRRGGELRPRKFFSIDRVYRNETLDATHLAEFHQVEGFVIDKNLSIGDLMSYAKDFFRRIGRDNLEFKPAYNPYTEPSMEIFTFSPERNGWIEIGNSGIFRPEMLEPMGLPPEWGVVAWGFSLERPTMIEYKLNEIRKLEGPNVSLKLIRDVPIARLSF